MLAAWSKSTLVENDVIVKPEWPRIERSDRMHTAHEYY